MIIEKLKAVLELSDKDKSLFSVARTQLLAERELQRKVIEMLIEQRDATTAAWAGGYNDDPTTYIDDDNHVIIDMLDKEKEKL